MRTPAPPRFISFEGVEACGKTTQIALLRQRLEALGHQVIVTREPGGTPLGEALRHLLKHAPEGKGITPEAELLLFSASRAELVRKVIRPALDSGAWVLADRFIDSTTVYQGCARGLSGADLAAIQAFAIGDILPSLTLLLEVSLEESKTNSMLRGSSDHFEDLPDSFFAKVSEGFRDLATRNPDRVLVIPRTTIPEVEAAIWRGVQNAFSL